MTVTTTSGDRWDQPGIPHRGWTFLELIDHEEPVFTCAMCGNPNVRYEHRLEHQDYPSILGVGCVCAEKMELDPTAPRERERIAKNAASRRSRALQRREELVALWRSPDRWRTSKNGNRWRKYKGQIITVFLNRWGGWKACVGDRFGAGTHKAFRDAVHEAVTLLIPIE
jgi:hypothetical protein